MVEHLGMSSFLQVLVVVGALHLVFAWLFRAGAGRVQEPPGFVAMSRRDALGLTTRGAQKEQVFAYLGIVPGLGHLAQGRWQGAAAWFGGAVAFVVGMRELFRVGCSCGGDSPASLALIVLFVGGVLAIIVGSSWTAGARGRRLKMAWNIDHAQARSLAADARQPSCPRCRAAQRTAGGFCATCAAQLAGSGLAVSAPVVSAATAPARHSDPQLRALRAGAIVRGSIGGDATRLPAAIEPWLDRWIERNVDAYDGQVLQAWTDPVDPSRVWLDVAARIVLNPQDVLELRTVMLVVLEGGKIAGTWAMSAWHFKHSAPDAVDASCEGAPLARAA